MKDTMLTAKLASLLEHEDPLITELILETVTDVEQKQISVEAHAKNIERMLDYQLQKIGRDQM